MTAEETNIVHHGIGTGPPKSGNRPPVVPARVKPDANHNVAAARGRFQQRLGTTDALISGCAIGQDNLRRTRMQPDQDRVRPQLQRVVYDVKTGGHVNGSVSGNRLLKNLRVIGAAVALGAQITQVDPGIARRQWCQVRGDGRRHRIQW